MNKGELIAFVQKELDETKAGAERCVNAVIDGIKKGVKKDSSAKPRSIHVEMSIKSVLARTGLATYPRTKSFKFSGPAQLAKAKTAAEAWLKSMGV